MDNNSQRDDDAPLVNITKNNKSGEPVPYVLAKPVTDDNMEWHYVLQGPEDTPYHGGYYYGQLVFPDSFPIKPPEIQMFTPSGRFKTNTLIYLSNSRSFNPESWNPVITVGTLLTALLSCMCEDTLFTGTIQTTEDQKRKLAKESLNFNLNDNSFVEIFPDTVSKIRLCQ